MARITKEIEKPQTTALVNWEQEMAAQADAAAAMEANSGGGVPRFSIRAGVLSLNDIAIPNGVLGAVIVDSILENAFYEGEYDSENVTPPTCFAMGRDESKIAPHQTVVDRGQGQHETCRGCPMNVFGTSERGRGKACKNRRRLMLIPAGEFDPQGSFKAYDDVEHFESTQAVMLSVPPTSIGGYATFVKQVAGTLRLPPHGIFTKISVKPDPKRQVVVVFEPISKIPSNLIPTIMRRNKDVAPIIEQPYNLDVEERPAQASGRGTRGAVKNTRPEVRRGKKY
jgi:hypothetical protein